MLEFVDQQVLTLACKICLNFHLVNFHLHRAIVGKSANPKVSQRQSISSQVHVTQQSDRQLSLGARLTPIFNTLVRLPIVIVQHEINHNDASSNTRNSVN